MRKRPLLLAGAGCVLLLLLLGGGAAPDASHLIQVADLELDDDAHEVRRAGQPVPLTPTEYRLLRYLMVNAGRALTRNQILDHVWEYDFGGDASVLETYISYLRRKIDRDGAALIQTVRGVGYALKPPRSSVPS